MATTQISVPDIGDFKEVDVIEVLVKAGDVVKPEQSLITVESDKATMEIPSPAAGVVKELRIKAGDKVSKGSLILLLDATAGAPATAPKKSPEPVAAAPAPARAAPTAPVVPIGRSAPRQPISRARPTPFPTRAPRCANSPGTWASICCASKVPVPKAESPRPTSRNS